VVESEALGGGPGQLIGIDGAAIEERLLRRNAGGAALLDRLVDLLDRGEAELDDVIGDEPSRPSPPGDVPAGWSCAGCSEYGSGSAYSDCCSVYSGVGSAYSEGCSLKSTGGSAVGSA
jgi:hypothetical protein